MLWKIIFSVVALYNIALSIYVFQKKGIIPEIFIIKHFCERERAAPNSIIDSIAEGIMVVDDRGNIIDINKAASRFILSNFSQNITKGFNIYSILSVWPDWLLACNNMQSVDFEIDTIGFGGNKFYTIRVNPVFDRQHRICGSVSTVIDITDRKVKEEERLQLAAEQSNQLLRELKEDLSIQQMKVDSIFDNMSDHCVVVDKEGYYIRMNKAAREFIPALKVSRLGDWLPAAKYYNIDGDEINADTVPAARVLKGEKLSNFRLIVKNKEEEIHFKVNGTPVYDDKGEFLFGIICSSDITELVEYEKEITFQNMQLETIINTISDMAILSITDKAGNFLFYSDSANHYFAENTFRVKIGDTYQRDMYFNEDGSEIMQHNMPVYRVLAGEKVTNFHYFIKTSETDTHFLFSGSPIYDKSGILTNAVFFNIDITEQVLHKNLVPVTEHLKELNAFKDRLFTVFSHDIRNPMANMINLIMLLGEDEEYYNDENKEIYLAVKEQVDHTYKIIENLLEWILNQKEGLNYKPLIIKLSDMVQEIMALHYVQAGIKKINIMSNIDGDMLIYVDRNILEMVLRNLLSNAIKFTDYGGVITFQSYETEDEAIISVQDTGIGMDYNQAEELFTTTSINNSIGTAGEIGIGIGLLMCKEFISLVGGKIWVDSSPGVGTTFYLSLPKHS
ncbi:MAG: hypothetical protein H6Q59_550 [Firmicutes bacterium]|nr:hypothetical protein [Bacillota bacterium]